MKEFFGALKCEKIRKRFHLGFNLKQAAHIAFVPETDFRKIMPTERISRPRSGPRLSTSPPRNG